MSRFEVEAMSKLRDVSPDEDALSWWTSAEEDALLAMVLSDIGNRDLPNGDLTRASAGPRRLVRVGLVAFCVLVVALVGLAVELIGSQTPGAFAAWTPTTTNATASQVANATSSCQHQYSIGLGLLPDSATATLPTELPPLVLTDSRGPFEMLLYAGSPGVGFVCLWGSSAVQGVTGGGGTQLPDSDDSIGLPTVPFERLRGSVLTYAYGHAGMNVTAVSLDLVNGVRVDATVHNGFYAAWWPSQADVSGAEVTTPEGVEHQYLGDVGPNDQGPPQN